MLLRTAVQKKAFGIRNSERFGLLYSKFGKIRFIEMRMHGFERNLTLCEKLRSVFRVLGILRIRFSEVGLYLLVSNQHKNLF